MRKPEDAVGKIVACLERMLIISLRIKQTPTRWWLEAELQFLVPYPTNRQANQAILIALVTDPCYRRTHKVAIPLFRTCFSKHSLADSEGLGEGDLSHTHPSNRYNPEGRELDSLSK